MKSETATTRVYPPELQPTLAAVCYALKAAEDARKTGDLVLTLQADGSGCIDDAHTCERFFTFDSISELRAWIAGTIRWQTRACALGVHTLCVHGPEQLCTCTCHQPKEDAA